MDYQSGSEHPHSKGWGLNSVCYIFYAPTNFLKSAWIWKNAEYNDGRKPDKVLWLYLSAEGEKTFPGLLIL